MTRVEPATVLNAEAYVLFYRSVEKAIFHSRKTINEYKNCRKNNAIMDPVREETQRLIERALDRPSLIQFYIGKQWLNKLENFAEPGETARPFANQTSLAYYSCCNSRSHRQL